MINLDITHHELKDLLDLLAAPHFLRIRVRLIDLDHVFIEDLSDNFYGGQVNVDADAEITRSLDLTLFDPMEAIHLDPDSPSKTSIYITNQISIVFVVQPPDRSKTYNIPVFTGPIDEVSREDEFLTLKCLGKESLSITNLWRGRTFKKGQEKTRVIKAILSALVGETKLSIVDRDAKLPNDMHLNRADKPWLVAKKMAKTMGFQLFYDGRGVATMRKTPSKTVFTFWSKYLTTSPQVTYDLKQTINAVDVTGHKPKKGKKRPSARAIADRSHPLSPWRLGRGGVPRYLWVEIQDDGLKSDKECRDLANTTLRNGLLGGVSLRVDGVPHPLLQELDVCRVHSTLASSTIRMKQFTIPLVAGDVASYGYLRKMKPRGGHKPIKVKHNHSNHGGHN